MPMQTPRFRKWQAAELAAQAVESEIRKRILESEHERQALDMHDELVFAAQLRRDAHALFLEAMEELDLVTARLTAPAATSRIRRESDVR
jgi:hypothetical protein